MTQEHLAVLNLINVLHKLFEVASNVYRSELNPVPTCIPEAMHSKETVRFSKMLLQIVTTFVGNFPP